MSDSLAVSTCRDFHTFPIRIANGGGEALSSMGWDHGRRGQQRRFCLLTPTAQSSRLLERRSLVASL